MEIDKSVETLIRVLVEKIEALETDNCMLRWDRDNLKRRLDEQGAANGGSNTDQ